MVKTSLIDSCVKGDHKAYKKLYELCAPYSYTIIRNYCSDSSYHKDILQEVFVELFKSLDKFNEEKGNFRSWLRRVTINRCLKFIRDNQKIFYECQEEKEYISVQESKYLLDQLDRESFRLTLDKMPIGYKTVLLLYYIEEFSHKEIANTLNIKKETSRSQLTRALSWVREHLQQKIKNQYL